MKLVNFSVDKPVAITMLVLIIVVLGGVSFTNIGVDLMPELEFPMVTVVTTYEGASSEDVENLLSKPIEELVGTVSNVKKLRSTSMEGLSIVSIELEWGTNIPSATADIREKLGLLRDFLPPDISDPLVLKFDTSMMPIIFMGATSDVFNQRELRKILNDGVKPRLERLEGVASAMLMGGEEYEIKVSLDRHKLEAYNISADSVVQSLTYENINMPGGHIQRDHYDFLLRTVGEFTSLEQMERTIVGATQFGQPIYLRDVGRAYLDAKEKRGFSRLNGKDAVALIISKQTGSNTLQVSRSVKDELKKVMKDLPEGINILRITDQGDDIQRMTNQISQNALTGGILAVLFMLFFLRSFRPTLAIALAIPLSVTVTFIAVYGVGYTLNFMTLGGISLGVGMLVDNAIVVIENIYRHLELGKSRWQAAKMGASEVAMAIIASTFTTVVVFLPMLFSSGIAGRLTRGLALTVSMSLFASLFVAFTIIPMFAALFFKRRSDFSGERYARFDFFKGILAIYDPALRWALGNRKKVILATLLAFLGSLALIPVAGAEFMPTMDTPINVFMLRSTPGTSLDETDRIATTIENRTKDMPEIPAIMINAGITQGSKFDAAFSGMGATDVNEAQIFFKLTPKEDRDISSQQISEIIRLAMPDLEGVRFQYMDIGKAMMGSTSQAPIEIKIFGKDLEALKTIGWSVAKQLEGVPGLRDIDMSMREGKPEVVVSIDKDKALRLGMPTALIANSIKTSQLGSIATRYREEGEEFDVRVIYDHNGYDPLDELGGLSVKSMAGVKIPIKDVTEIKLRQGPLKIERESQTRKVTVTANLSDRDLRGAMTDVIAAVDPLKKDLPIGYNIEYAGDYETMIDTFIEMFKAFLLAILFVYMVMAAQFESFRQPFIIMFTMPLSAVGIILALLLFGKTVSMISALGVLILMGIVVNNGIVLIDYVNQLRRGGMELMDALVQGGRTRLRPILITAGTTIFGMFPMAFTTTQGAEIRSPMALVIVGGLTASTFLTLIVIPVIYSYLGGRDVRSPEEIAREAEAKAQAVREAAV